MAGNCHSLHEAKMKHLAGEPRHTTCLTTDECRGCPDSRPQKVKEGAMFHVWGFLGDVTWALSRNNAVGHCYVSLATQQLKRRAYQQLCYARNNRHRDVSMVFGILLILSVVFGNRASADVRVCLAMDSFWLEDWVSIGKLREKHVSLYRGQQRQPIVGASAEVLLWCASGLIAWRWIVPTCVWRLSDCKNVSSCWKVATRGPVGKIL
jgi:hypothetical protein